MEKPKEHHVVTFYSPGTLVSETRDHDVPGWDPLTAADIAKGVVERHGARPYGFKFRTELRAQNIDDGYGGKMRVEPKTVRESSMYFIAGRVMTLDEVKREMPEERILISNMECNDYGRIVRTQNGYSHCAVFKKGDKLVDINGVEQSVPA